MLKRLRGVLGLSAGHFVIDIYSPVIPAILPLLIASYGYSYFAAGVLAAAFNITSSLLQPIAGMAADRRGALIPIGLPIIISAVAVSAYGVVEAYPLLLICACCAGIGHATFHPTALAAVNRLSRAENRGRITSIFVIGGNFGFAVGPVLAGLIVVAFGLPGLVWLVIPGIIAGIAFLVFRPGRGGSGDHPGATDVEDTGPLSYRPILLLITVGALRSWVIFGSIAYLPAYIHAQLGVDLLTADALVSLMLVAGVVGQYVGGHLSDRYGRKEYTLFGLSAAVLPFLLFISTSGVLSYAALLLFGFLLWSTFSVTVAMAQEVLPGRAGLASGLMLGLAVGAGGLGVAASGAIADASSLGTALSLLLLPIVAAALLMTVVPYPWKSLAGRVRDRL
ncbi:MFS transporter [Methanofollis fontis]|uniref:MFS transporter n=1 Tax=Methanofollis fontis TaxID=2052832 RepID=A0A483CWY9_9EURY|nr:MFS transporter [Methanofollis fontis]TAJ43537.1 MFS transporter [Methanofollis fontis]